MHPRIILVVIAKAGYLHNTNQLVFYHPRQHGYLIPTFRSTAFITHLISTLEHVVNISLITEFSVHLSIYCTFKVLSRHCVFEANLFLL